MTSCFRPVVCDKLFSTRCLRQAVWDESCHNLYATIWSRRFVYDELFGTSCLRQLVWDEWYKTGSMGQAPSEDLCAASCLRRFLCDKLFTTSCLRQVVCEELFATNYSRSFWMRLVFCVLRPVVGDKSNWMRRILPQAVCYDLICENLFASTSCFCDKWQVVCDKLCDEFVDKLIATSGICVKYDLRRKICDKLFETSHPKCVFATSRFRHRCLRQAVWATNLATSCMLRFDCEGLIRTSCLGRLVFCELFVTSCLCQVDCDKWFVSCWLRQVFCDKLFPSRGLRQVVFDKVFATSGMRRILPQAVCYDLIAKVWLGRVVWDQLFAATGMRRMI